MYDLRKSHEQAWAFDLAAGVLGLSGGAAGLLALSRGGWWWLLGAPGLVGLGILVYGMLIAPRLLRIRNYQISTRAEAAVKFSLVFLSDLHAGGFRDKAWYARIVDEVNALQPDAVVLGGDFVVDRYEPVGDLEILSKLRAPQKYFLIGNHDYLDRPDLIRKAIAGWGFQDLTNEKVQVEKSGRKFELGGVDSLWSGAPKLPKRTSKEMPYVLISHEPDILQDMREGDAELVVCGHTHGGQVRLPGLAFIPANLGRAVDLGRKTVFGIQTIISEGLGETDLRARLGTRPEIVAIELKI